MDQQTGDSQYNRPRGYAVRVLFRKLYRLVVQPRVVRQEKLVIVDESTRCTNPVFVIGVHRSGTTLMRQIIDAHPNIACPPETLFLEMLAKAVGHENYFKGLRAMGFDQTQAEQLLVKYVAEHFEAYRQAKDKPRWADKTPQYTTCLPFIEQLFGPTCQYVFVYRHPFDIVNSLMSKGWRLDDFDDDPFANTAMYVDDRLRRMIRFQEQLETERFFELRYEQLAQAPRDTLEPMFERLGEPWADDVMNFNDKPHDRGLGDAEAMTLKGFRPSINNWHEWSAGQLEKARRHLGETCEKLNYPTEP